MSNTRQEEEVSNLATDSTGRRAHVQSSCSKRSSSSTCNSSDIPTEVYGALYSLADKWCDVVDVKNLIIRPLKGAMTNHVYECQWPQHDRRIARKVLVRVYGDGCEMLFRREDEIRTFERMSQLGQGPRLLSRFPNGRVEEFLNARTLTAADLRDPAISARIASKLKEFHQLDMPGPQKPQVWGRLRFWLCKALEICLPDCLKEFQVASMDKEISKLETILSKPGEKIGFCHNDLQYGNIMMDETDGSVTIIDYEYASFNPVAFDIANHFCEMTANYHTDTPHLLDFSKYPDHLEQSKFVEAYMKDTGSTIDKQQLLEEIECYTLVSHLHWGLWGILTATFSDINFNYVEYARQRFQLYYKFKTMVIKDGSMDE